MIIGGQTVMGKQDHGGAVEHMTLIPGGRQCYCGKSGCMETYCSVNALLLEDETWKNSLTDSGMERKRTRYVLRSIWRIFPRR